VITPSEFDGWCAKYRNEPFDDYHRYHRPAALIALRMAGGNIGDLLDWLQPPPPTGHTSADMDLFKAAGIRPPPRKSAP
jgi:hypothetical protein